jgi:hypothetical protein
MGFPDLTYPTPPQAEADETQSNQKPQSLTGLPYTLPSTTPTWPRLAEPKLGKSRRRTAYPQQIVTTRLLYCLQDRFAQLSRLQRI